MDLQASYEIPEDALHEDRLVKIITQFGQKSRELDSRVEKDN